MTNALTFYATHDLFTETGNYTAALQSLPGEPAERGTLHRAINGVLLHVWKVRRDHPEWLTERPYDVGTRRIVSVLERIHDLSDESLTIARPPEKRAIVDCRTFALFQCALLRTYGVPARVRCGFATYLEPTHYQDHWICEWWEATGSRWVRDDPDVNRTDLEPDAFYTGAEAWLRCRKDPNAGRQFGYGPTATGAWTTRGNLVRDFAALNGFPCVSGDSWGLAYRRQAQVTPEDTALLDQAARLSQSDADFVERTALYQARDELQMPDLLHHWDYVAENRYRPSNWRTEP